MDSKLITKYKNSMKEAEATINTTVNKLKRHI